MALALARKAQESVILTMEGKDGPVEVRVKVARFQGERVILAITAPKSVTIEREEIIGKDKK